MKITLSIIKDFINISKSCKDISHLLTLAGIEVDKIENETPPFSGVVSVKVVDVQKHPKADKLVIAQVFDGKENHQVVCGASNCRSGIITAFAKDKATLKDENDNIIEIKKTKIRDIETSGMLCSAKELRLFEESDKIIELDCDLNLGIDLSYLSTPIFEISLTPNLGHLLNGLGLARELAAITKNKINMPSLDLNENPDLKNKIDISLEDKRCSRYCTRIIENILIEDSPFWLKNELEACGFRSINNVVDVLNYVMLKFGQPLHAYDLDKIEGNRISICSNPDEIKFVSLDKNERLIPKNAIIIKDEKKIITIAGIIGSKSTEVDKNTKRIIIESAFFDPIPIRKTSKSLGLKTESSMRFEKSIDPNMVQIAIDYAAQLIAKLSKKQVSISKKNDVKKSSFDRKKITLRFNRVKKILGTNISESEIEEIFNRLEFNILQKNDEAILIEIPTYRNDINEEIDLIEEVARIYGYNNLTKVNPYFRNSSVTHSKAFLFEKRLHSYLRNSSLQEIKTCDLISPKLSETALINFDRNSLISVKHYKSIDQSILRPTLLPSLLEVVQFNHARKNFDIQAYEISKIHFKENDKYIERSVLSTILSGKRNPHLWDKSNFDVNFYDLKGMLENILSAALNKSYKFKNSSFKDFYPFKQAALLIEDQEFGVIGEVHPNVLNQFDIKKRVFFSEININFLIDHSKDLISFSNFSDQPCSQRDFTISLNEREEAQKIFDIVEKFKSTILENIFLLDIFKSPENKNNLTFRFIYRDKNRTISNEEIETEHTQITKEIIKQLEK
ncbi:MAG: phenylalanine--tRNA ligase subunit beta [Parachlamydiales bacterium]|jgi:phenylalanyl-tRNA synthetase beta chain